jgi:hypothetical protein
MTKQNQEAEAAVQEKPRRRTRKIKFMNNEDPNVDLAFSYRPKGVDEPESYRLFPGYVYELPVDVIEHLNNQTYPIYSTQLDPNTGQIQHVRQGSYNRFTCHPVE